MHSQTPSPSGGNILHMPVVDTVDDFAGFTAVSFRYHKRGVLRVLMTRIAGRGVEAVDCVAKQRLVTTAREMEILKRR